MFRKHFRSKIFLMFCLVFTSQYAYSQELKNEKSNFSRVVYQYPFQFFFSGFKLGLDINMNDRYVLQLYTQHVFSHYPRFYSIENEINPLDVTFFQDKISDAKLGLMVKSRFGRSSNVFHGRYLMTFAEMGNGWESYSTRLSKWLPESRFTNTYKYQKFGIGIGRHWTLFNQSVLDINMGLGFNNYAGKLPKSYQPAAIFIQGSDQVFAFANVGMGFGKKKEDVTPQNDWKLRYGLTIDFKAMLKNSMELGLLCRNKPKSLMHLFAMYGSHELGEQNITSAFSFTNFVAGAQYRKYPYAGLRKEGIYFAGGFSTGYTKAVFQEFSNKGEVSFVQQEYFPQHLVFSMGVTTFVANRFLLDLFASNTYTISKGNPERQFPHPDEASGIQTSLGIKLGIVQLFKNEY